LAVFPGATREDQAKALMAASTQQVLDAFINAKYPRGGGMTGYSAMSAMYGPVLDGKVMPAQIWETDAPAISAALPLMIGTTADEMTSMLMMDPGWPGMDDAALKSRIEATFGAERGDKVLALYRAKFPSYKPMHIYSAIMSDSFFTKGAIRNAELKAAQHSGPAYLYKTTWTSPVLGGKLRAAHGIDTPFFMDNIDVARGFVGPGEEPVAMGKAMSGIIAAFARTGVPDVPGQPHWPAFDPQTRQTMLFALPLHVVRDPDADTRMLWAQR
jgi:para-nitrobenzyl esterase